LQAPLGAEEVEILRVVGQSLTVNYNPKKISDIFTNIVRETLSEDLIERFILDILEITEQLTSKPPNKSSHYQQPYLFYR
jgi:glutamate decarboxylase